jgi:hypothetical protein
MYPDLGKSGTPYARSVPPMTIMDGVAPDAGLIFDCTFFTANLRPVFLLFGSETNIFARLSTLGKEWQL